MTAIVLRGDARDLPLPDASVDLIVTSPPYFGQRDYQDNGSSLDGQIGAETTPAKYIRALTDCTREWVRVLKPTGSMFVNLGDKFSQRIQVRRSSHQPGIFPGKFPEFADSWAERAACGATRMPHQNVINDDGMAVAEKSLMLLPERYVIAAADELGLIVRRDNIWAKLSTLPESVTDRCATRHEYIYHLVKRPQYYASIDEVREPHAEVSVRRAMPHRAPAGRRAADIYRGMASQTLALAKANHPLGKLPGSVWEMASTPLIVPPELGAEHHAAFPFELPRRCILGWSPAGAVVLDPFGGSGTTALVADVLGRTGVTVDRSADYCRLATWRTQDPAERARALGVAKPPPVPDGQMNLFGEAS